MKSDALKRLGEVVADVPPDQRVSVDADDVRQVLNIRGRRPHAAGYTRIWQLATVARAGETVDARAGDLQDLLAEPGPTPAA